MPRRPNPAPFRPRWFRRKPLETFRTAYTHALRVLAADGCFHGEGLFRAAPGFDVTDLEKLSRLEVPGILLRTKKIASAFVRMLCGWRHAGFNVFAGEPIQPCGRKSLENPAAGLIRITFSQKRMACRPCSGERETAGPLPRPANARPVPRAHSPPGLRPLPEGCWEDSCSQRPAREEEDHSRAPPADGDDTRRR